MLAQMLEPTSRRHSSDFEGILDSDWQSGEGAERVTTGALPVDFVRGCAGPVAVERDDEVVGRIEAVDTLQIELEQLGGADLAGFEQPRLLGGRCERERL